MNKYSIYYKSRMPLTGDISPDNGWDIFLSAYNISERVKSVFDRVRSSQKEWILFPDYPFAATELPSKFIAPAIQYEAEFIKTIFERYPSIETKKICIDITGFMRPHLVFLIKYFKEKGLSKFDLLYSEPERYTAEEKTKFSDEVITEIRQIAGFEGVHNPDTSKDLLIIGSGYDDKLIARVAEFKDYARKIQIFGFPSLQAMMYQENVLRALRAEAYIGSGVADALFAPANDPFITAQVLSDIFTKEQVTNLYLCPIATKPQAVGFALFYLQECCSSPVSIIFPFTRSYSKETSKGISRLWRYTIEFI